MEVVALLLVSIVLLKYIFKIDIKKIEPLKENKELENYTNKFPENVDIAKEMLNILKNDKVKIEEVKNTQTSLYVAVTNKILIADMKNNYARIQTIAHECLHSIQDRRLLIFNFIFSNINIIYLIGIIIFTLTHTIQNTMLHIFILTLFAIIKLAVRGYLEIDAMTNAKYFAKEYMESKKLLTKKEVGDIVKKYNEITQLGIPFTIVQLLTTSLLEILVYAIIVIVI